MTFGRHWALFGYRIHIYTRRTKLYATGRQFFTLPGPDKGAGERSNISHTCLLVYSCTHLWQLFLRRYESGTSRAVAPNLSTMPVHTRAVPSFRDRNTADTVVSVRLQGTRTAA